MIPLRRSKPRLAPQPPRSDAAVVACIADGDVRALGELYDLYAPALLRFARHIGPNDEAEDVVQGTFLRVLRIAHKFDPKVASARPWLFAIAARLTQERRRSVRRLSAALLGMAYQPREANVQRGDQATDLERGLSQLSHAKRVVLVLSEVEGFTCEQVAALLDVPVGTIWTRLHHARRELRNFLDEA